MMSRRQVNASDGFVSYATTQNAAACAPSLTWSYFEDFTVYGGGRQPRLQHIAANSSAIKITSCGAAVTASAGRLPQVYCIPTMRGRGIEKTAAVRSEAPPRHSHKPPPPAPFMPQDLCSTISRQMASANNASNDIGADTALYTVDWADMAPPPSTPIADWTILVHLAPSVPQQYSVVPIVVPQPCDILVTAGPNTPARLRKTYGATAAPRGTSKGTVAAVSPPGTSFYGVYAYSQFDLAIANRAQGLTTPAVKNVVFSPYYVANNASYLYAPVANASNDGWFPEASESTLYSVRTCHACPISMAAPSPMNQMTDGSLKQVTPHFTVSTLVRR